MPRFRDLARIASCAAILAALEGTRPIAAQLLSDDRLRVQLVRVWAVVVQDESWIRYPVFRTVRMCRGSAAFSSSLRLSSATWVSTVLLYTSPA